MNKMKTSKKILVLGIGNEILMDDGIGPKLVKELQKNNPCQNIQYVTTFTGGLDILEFIQEYKTVVFIDSIKTQNGISGSVYHFTPANFRETLHLSNLHDTSFLTALELGEKMKMKIPKEIHIIAVEIIEDTVFGNSFTTPIREKYPEILRSVNNLVKSITGIK